MKFRLASRVFAVACLLALFAACGAAMAQPALYESSGVLGDWNVTSGNLVINTDTLTMTWGVQTQTGVVESGVAKFEFANLSVGAGVVVTVVGAAIRNTPGVAGRIFTAVGEGAINVIAIAMGSSECSISLGVDGPHAREAVRQIHRLLA